MSGQNAYYHIRNIVEAYQMRDADMVYRKIRNSQRLDFQILREKDLKISKKLIENAEYYLAQIQIAYHQADIPKLREILKKLAKMVDYSFYKKGRAISAGKKQAKQARQML